MLTLTEQAVKELEAFFADRDREPIRIFLAPGGCSGPRLALALDAPGDEDQALEAEGFSFCIRKDLLDQVEAVAIDASPLGFELTPKNPLPSTGGSACGSCCGGCGSH